ncbi:hypothetical protein D3C75_702350 [compost metagenome]
MDDVGIAVDSVPVCVKMIGQRAERLPVGIRQLIDRRDTETHADRKGTAGIAADIGAAGFGNLPGNPGIIHIHNADITVRSFPENNPLGPLCHCLLQYILQAEPDKLNLLHRLAVILLGKMINLCDKHHEIVLRKRNTEILPSRFSTVVRSLMLHQEGQILLAQNRQAFFDFELHRFDSILLLPFLQTQCFGVKHYVHDLIE